jgi:WD40 repeat protein
LSDYSLNWVVTGSKDCTVVVWEVGSDKETPINPNPLHILHGHDDAVICIAGNAELDTLVSGSRDGTIMVHSLRTGMYIRSISPSSHDIQSSVPDLSNSPNQVKQRRIINLLCISKHGYIITYSIHGNLLSTYSINGRFIKMIDTGEKLNVMILSEDNTVVLTGGERCLVVLRWVNSLTLANTGSRYGLEAIIDGDNDDKGPFSTPIRSLHLTQFERHLIVGLESGHIRILAHDAEYLKQRLQSKLLFLGILG